MAKSSLTFDAVRKAGLTLTDVTESTVYGSPALKVHGAPTCAATTQRHRKKAPALDGRAPGSGHIAGPSLPSPITSYKAAYKGIKG
jgi:hypothetical protein